MSTNESSGVPSGSRVYTVFTKAQPNGLFLCVCVCPSRGKLWGERRRKLYVQGTQKRILPLTKKERFKEMHTTLSGKIWDRYLQTQSKNGSWVGCSRSFETCTDIIFHSFSAFLNTFCSSTAIKQPFQTI